MKSLALISALAALSAAVPQEIAWDVVDEVPAPPTASVPIGVAAQTIVYNDDAAAASVAAAITADPLPQATDVSKRGLQERAACATQPTGAGPVPTDDTASAFLSYPSFSSAASAAPTPSGYYNTFTNLQASNNAYGYMGFTTLSSYDPELCARKCNAITGCSAINIYFERDPTVDPGTGCTNPPSTTNIKCVFWGGLVTKDNANNKGQYRNQFQVVIAGSNGYVSKSIAPQDGYTGPTYLGNAAINAPLDCAGDDTFMGSTMWSDKPFDAGLCAAACSAQSDYNLAHPPAAPAKPKTCQYFNTYLLLKNGVTEGQYCAMYTESWDSSYAKNTGQYRGSDKYTIAYSYTFVNSTNPGKPRIPCPVASASSTIGASSYQPYCSSLLGYTTPLTTSVTTVATTVPSSTVVVTSTPLTTTITTTTQLIATTQVKKRDLPAPSPVACNHDHSIDLPEHTADECSHDHSSDESALDRRDDEPTELVKGDTFDNGTFVDIMVVPEPAAARMRRRAVTPAAPAGLSGFSADVISSACSLQATPVTTTSTILATTSVTATSGAITTTTTGSTSTITNTATVTSTTTILVASSAPTGAIGYLKVDPAINSGASYALSDDATHMTDNWFYKNKRETFIVTEDGYLYSVTNDSYYLLKNAANGYSYLWWSHTKAEGMKVFSYTTTNGKVKVQLKPSGSSSLWNFCARTVATGDGNTGAGMHIYAFAPSFTTFPSSDCKSVDLILEAI